MLQKQTNIGLLVDGLDDELLVIERYVSDLRPWETDLNDTINNNMLW